MIFFEKEIYDYSRININLRLMIKFKKKLNESR